MRIPGVGPVTPKPASNEGTLNVPGFGWYKVGNTPPCYVVAGGPEPSPEFITAMSQKAPVILRQFRLNHGGGLFTDLSSRVIKWPTFKIKSDKLVPGNVSIQLDNVDGALNYLVMAGDNLGDEATISYGLAHPNCPDEMLQLFNGTIDSSEHARSIVTLSLLDRFAGFGTSTVGSETSPIDRTAPDIHVADLLWEIVTVYGGLDATASVANPDIDYTSWLAWKAAPLPFARVEGYFTGQKVLTLVQDIGRVFSVSILFENSKLHFGGFEFTPPQAPVTFTEAAIVELRTRLDAKKIENTVTVPYNKDPLTGAYAGEVVSVSGISVTNYGPRTSSLTSSYIWPSDIGSATRQGDVRVDNYRFPIPDYHVDALMQHAHIKINSQVNIADAQLGIDILDLHRVIEKEINLDTGETKWVFTIDR